ncbi:MAG TPA: phosphoribosyltransferase family protein [Chloroflexota bacterium]
MIFRDRVEAGRQLAERLREYAGRDAIVLGIPRGGVVVAAEVARALGLPLDVIITRKIGAPGNPEYAIGAVAEDGEPVLNTVEVQLFAISPSYLRREVERVRQEVHRRAERYRQGRPLPRLEGKIVVVVDDGLATGYTMLAAVRAARARGAREIVVAVPVASLDGMNLVDDEADRVVALQVPEVFLAVGSWYEEFPQVTDDEVLDLLARFRAPTPT